MAQTVAYRSFNVDNISFGNPKVSKDNNKSINIHFIDNNIQFIQTPKDVIPFEPYDNNFCFSVNDKFKAKLQEIEDYIIKKAVENSVLWFGVQKTDEEVRETFIPIFQQKNPDFPPFTRINFSQNNEIYTHDNKLIDKSSIKGKTTVRLIIKLGKLYIRSRDNQMKLIMYLEQAKLFETANKSSRLTSYAFIDDDDE